MRTLSLIISLIILSSCSKEVNKGNNDPYTDTSQKRLVPCPEQTGQTLVLYTFGQSNSANSLAKLYSNSDSRIINYFNGKCYVAADPLLGATGDRGSQWVVASQKLMATGQFDYIIINSFGVGGSGIGEWVTNPEYIRRYKNPDVSIYLPTHFLWHQGESDAAQGTSTSNYQTWLNQIIQDSVQNFPGAKFYVSLATICNGSLPYEPVRAAQRNVVDNLKVFQGPDTDQILDRYDGCHIGATGQEQIGDFWQSVINL
jgi:hypothetical protein